MNYAAAEAAARFSYSAAAHLAVACDAAAAAADYMTTK